MGDRSRMDKCGSWEIKVQEAGEQGMGSRNFQAPYPPSTVFSLKRSTEGVFTVPFRVSSQKKYERRYILSQPKLKKT